MPYHRTTFSWHRLLRSQRGAVFGMDARLALAIMAGMSVIVGYYSISRILVARDMVLLQELQAIDEALAMYQSDLAAFPYFTSDTPDDISILWDVNKVKPGFRSKWNGPYYRAQDYQNRDKRFGNYLLSGMQEDSMTACTNSSRCFMWIVLQDVEFDTMQALNHYADEHLGTFNENSSWHSQGRIMARNINGHDALLYRSVERPR